MRRTRAAASSISAGLLQFCGNVRPEAIWIAANAKHDDCVVDRVSRSASVVGIAGDVIGRHGGAGGADAAFLRRVEARDHRIIHVTVTWLL